MRYKFSTASGAEYKIDTEAMTWKRRHPTTPIMGAEGLEGGRLAFEPSVSIASRAKIWDTEEGLIYTTRVVRIELLSDFD